MLTGILLISLVVFIAVVSYRRPRLEERVIKNIPLVDWLNILVFPIVFYYGLILIVRNIMSRPRISILDFEDVSLLAVGILFLIYGFVGLSVHFVGKVLSRYIKSSGNSKIYAINEVFHGKLSHYIVFVCTYMLVFILALLEINYPLIHRLSFVYVSAITVCAVFGGFSGAKSIFFTSGWFGGYNKPLFSITAVLLLVLMSIFRSDGLNLSYYPVNIFVMTLMFTIVWTFLIRQFLIFSKLSRKRRLQFLSKLLSV
ncbi:MAG: hypothetical protein UV73_C0005G0104 [Candidatus Gottesmanbacteria bacterium GW2011_GWA2_43_14]|uniref:Uncharacterized protein n=1 Tax=Candidatus Gottesmanbacteria bacterium GW2011_GWA2_43_14 TaxID=1618443 RepID=A0A0G1DJR9_9BACT|nr:MAG: hypothetical protein UV73_C0005G0104 [Candidatus Gottesmanbacteria bacterium GW2011_GWA2_43_14]